MSDDETRGEAIKRRRESLGMPVSGLAKRAEMDWKTVSRAESDHEGTTDLTYSRLESALDAFTHEVGAGPSTPADAPAEPGLVRFRLTGNFGVEVVVEGPVSDLAEIESSVARLVKQIGEKQD